MKQNSKNILNLINILNPLDRNANSDGVEQAFNIIKKKHLIKSKIHNFFSGLKAEDWIVPNRWKLNHAFIKNSRGKTIVSSKLLV